MKFSQFECSNKHLQTALVLAEKGENYSRPSAEDISAMIMSSADLLS